MADQAAQRAVLQISAPDAVAVCHQRAVSRQLHHLRTVHQLHTNLVAQERTAPCIVVAAHEVNGYAGIHYIGERGEYPKVATLDDRPVLEPEVEEVAVDQQPRGVLRGVAQELAEAALGTLGHRAEVDVGDYEVGFRHDGRKS